MTASPSKQLQGAQCFIVELFEQTSRGGEGRNVAMRLPADRPAPISVVREGEGEREGGREEENHD